MESKTTGKQRAVRIPLDYYKHRDALSRWKLGLAFLAPLLALAWWFGGDAWSSGQSGLRASHGPVAAVHATWEHQCEACHVPFQPVGPETWPAPYLKKYIGVPFVNSDAKCQTCHEGPPHHASQIAGKVPSCASCHRDHRGRDASLVRSPDRDCTSCHGSLAEHIRKDKDVQATGYGNVHSFFQDHPEFAVLRTPEHKTTVRLGEKGLMDPSQLKFNHAVHMTAGMRQGFTLEKITDEDDRKRYRLDAQKDTAEVQLRCASCHMLDPGDFQGRAADGTTASQSPGRGGPGTIMMPIVYENQCRACHLLDVSRPGAGRKATAAEGEGEGEGEAPAGPTPLPTLTVPHGLQPSEIHAYLYNIVAGQVLASDPGLQRRRRLPGPVDAETQQVREAIEAAVLQAEQVLFVDKQTCTECHDYTTVRPDEAVEVQLGAAPNFTVQKPDIPDVWFPHAVFDHSAHRAVDCRQCHARAYPTNADGAPNPEVATTSEPVMLPGIETCRKCHAPLQKAAGKVRGGARFDCVECHRYHNGDHPRQGVGALAQDARVEGTIVEFLNRSGPFDRAGTGPAPGPP